MPEVAFLRREKASYVPIVSFTIKDVLPERAAAEMSEAGYCLRAGYHCAAVAHAYLGTENGTIRFAPSVFSREKDAAELAGFIKNRFKNKKSVKNY